MDTFTSYFALPKVVIEKSCASRYGEVHLYAKSISTDSVCRSCGHICAKLHDYQTVRIREPDVIKRKVILILRKKRYWCNNCNKAHSEYIPGISPRARTSERFRRWVFDTALRFSSLTLTSKYCRVSSWFVFHYFHKMMQLKLREFQNPWPSRLGIDEHSFKKNKRTGETEYVTVFVDHINRKMRMIVLGRCKTDLLQAIRGIKDADKVQAVSIDLSNGFREFVKEAFPNASIVADKFHVMRLFGKLITRERIDALGDKRRDEISLLLKIRQSKMSDIQRRLLKVLLGALPKLREVYEYKIKMYKVYRQPNKSFARKCFIELLDQMALSLNPLVATLRDTLRNWFNEILNYYNYKITNGRVEGFNNKCKQVQRKGYGYRNIDNYVRRCLGESLLYK